MMWKFPSKTQPVPQSSPWSEELTNEKLKQVTKRLCSSVYQNDYLGIPQGFQVKSAFGDLPPDWKDRVPYTLDSQQRFSYRTPKQQREHLLTVNRYGCNRNKRIPAAGAIPTANMRAADIKTRTTYDRHYNESAPDVAAQAHDLSRLLVLDAIKFNNEKPFVPEKRRSKSRATGEDVAGEGDLAHPVPTPPSGPRPAIPSPCWARPRVPEATPITTTYGADYGPAPPSFQTDNSTEARSDCADSAATGVNELKQLGKHHTNTATTNPSRLR